MYKEIYKTEEQFIDDCPCAYRILDFVEGIKDTDVRWFFDVGYGFTDERRYCIIFKSYITDEYKDYVLSVEAKYQDNQYHVHLVKKVDNLLNNNG